MVADTNINSVPRFRNHIVTGTFRSNIGQGDTMGNGAFLQGTRF